MAPSYIRDMISPYIPKRMLRSYNKLLLSVPTVNTGTYGKRAFSVTASYLWNQLPEPIKTANNIEQFKKLLKTYLFKKAFNLSP